MKATLEHIKRVQSTLGSLWRAGTLPDVERKHICRECECEWSESVSGAFIMDIACSIARAFTESVGEIQWEEAIDIALRAPLADLCDNCFQQWQEAERQ